MKTYIHRDKFSQSIISKLIIPLGHNEWHGFTEECVWVKHLGNDLYQIENIPFFAKGLAYLDIVHAELENGEFIFKTKFTSSRTSTYRVFVPHQASGLLLKEGLNKLVELGCTYESYKESEWTLYAFDVPPNIVDAAYSILHDVEKKGLWDFEEGYFGGRDN